MENKIQIWYEGTYNSFAPSPIWTISYDYSTEEFHYRFVPEEYRGGKEEWENMKMNYDDIESVKAILKNMALIEEHIRIVSSRPIGRIGVHFETDRIVVDYMGKRHETERPSQTALVDAIESIYNKYVRKVIYGNGPRKHIDFDLSDLYDENGNLK